MNTTIEELKKPLKFKLFLLAKLPMGFLAGLKVTDLTEEKSIIGIKYKFLTQNPFGSIYFACLGMAGEMASGILSLMHVKESKASVSMLVVEMHASFHKKAVGRILFTCEDGEKIKNAINDCIETNVGQNIVAKSTGRNSAGEVVAEFTITWSYKVRKA